ncbi:antiviral RADAR system adenosine triphosphatase RdrA [Hafnia paralvei]
MSGEIVLNLDLPEYQDDFLSSDTNGEQNGLWQQEGNKRLVDLLTKMGTDAKSYKEEHAKYATHDAKLSSYHHAIFISGARGTGKTVFLRNAKAVWEKYKQTVNSASTPNLHFIDVIDPTLLNINDRFSEVIIASVYASVGDKLQQPNIKQECKDRFFSALKDLSAALGQASEFDEFRGIDRIQKYRSGIHIERYFHQFLIASADLLGCDALVLPIDDVDMKIDNAFGVLDDIRCLLSCPLILPLVSGDDDLYRHITTMKFEESLAKNKDASNFEDGKSVAERLSNAYLTKVFPNHVRLPLVSISQLLSKLKIQYKNEAGTKEPDLMYSTYEKNIKEIFYPLCNGQERSTDWPQPESAREVTQLVRLLSPIKLEKYKDNVDSLWKNYYSWAEEKQDGTALTNAESFLKISSIIVDELLDLSKVSAFNPALQKGRYRWAEKNFYAQQIQRIEELKVQKYNKKILDTVFCNPDKVQSRTNNTLRSLPALEFIMDPMYISKKIAQRPANNRLLLSIFTHHDYYSPQRNRRYHIFFSRAFEILAWSLIAITNNLPKKFYESMSLEEQINGLFLRAPFYSIFAMNPTKSISEDADEGDDYDMSFDYNSESKILSRRLFKWYKKNELKSLSGYNFIPLLSSIFNKVFTQINILRENVQDRKKFKDEHLFDLTKRFEYIFINALASFVREGSVVNTNVATGAESARVRDVYSFIKYDRTLSRNISGIFKITDENPDRLTRMSKKEYAKLLEAMWTHPIFELANDVAYPIGEVRTDNSVSDEVADFTKMNFEGLKDYYLNKSKNTNIKIHEVANWAVQNPGIAENMYNKMSQDDDIYNKTGDRSLIGRMFSGLCRGLGYEE